MKKEKKKSRYQAIADVLTKFQKEFANLTPQEAEEKLRLVIIQYVGDFSKSYTDLVINATAADLALMTTEVKFLATAAKFSLQNAHPVERKMHNNERLEKLTTDAEKSIQRYFLHKAKQLGLGKNAYKDLANLIQANMPE